MKKGTELTHEILVKLNDDDRIKATKLKEMGLNLTQLFRLMIRDKYEKIMNEK